MNNNKIDELKKLQELFNSNAISQEEFSEMKKSILDGASSEVTASVYKKSHKIRNIILIFVALLFVVIVVGISVYITKNNSHNESPSYTKNDTNTHSKKAKQKINDSSSEISSQKEQVSSSEKNDSGTQLFNNLDQKIQLGSLYSFAVQRAGSYNSYWMEADIVNADLNSANIITLYPNHGNTDIVFVDKHNGAFEYTINNSGTVEDSGVVTASELYEISQRDTQVRTWASEIEMK